MDQLVFNCLLYNPEGTFVRDLGKKVEARWLDNWRRSAVLQGVPVSRMPKPKVRRGCRAGLCACLGARARAC